ncbi:MAG: hypothetical protein LBD78_07730 [Spirochaetaceae bacterium]|jgi:hypothetical protein|nr:hypothetical protein [Spirochaetaceae bacterium]
MKKKTAPWLRICATLCLAGCAGLPTERAEPGQDALQAEKSLPEESAADISGNKPEQAPFTELPPRSLPADTRAYLEALSAAFRNGDRNFLLSQGEAQFEAEVRSFYDEETYLALLYRIGPYGQESPRTDTETPRLNPEEILRIEYADWGEQGPLLELHCRLIRRRGPPLPCLIMLVWRLPEPKILGRFP